MAEVSRPGAGQINRVFEQPADAASFYCDYAQIVGTEHEVVLQFYETIPGPPGPSGTLQMVRCRLRANVTIGKTHAVNIGRLLLERTGQQPASADSAVAKP